MDSPQTPLQISCYVPSTSVLCEVLERGAILLDLETGRYFELDGIGVELWNRLDGTASAEDLARFLVQTYRIDPDLARADTENYLRELREVGLITPASAI